MEATKRATIRDRYNILLAVNTLKYQAAINYSHLREIPAISWEKDVSGKRIKHFQRREYISQLSQLLGKELQLDPDRIEDLIHSKAALYYHIPFVIKDNLSEEEFYRLKYLEKDYPGVIVLKVPKRVYPFGNVGGDVIGYMGAINAEEYENIIQEIKELKKYLKAREDNEDPDPPRCFASPSEVRKRLREIEYRAYTINDFVRKAGIEAAFEPELRGFKGEKKYYANAQGNFLRELPGSKAPQSGQRLFLSISQELQEYVETLLIQNETLRKEGSSSWIKGGAAVVMDPNTGEILTLASYPRHNPNDFIPGSAADNEKKEKILKWYETESYIAHLWDQKKPLEKEIYDPVEGKLCIETCWLTWDQYLAFILPEQSPIKKALDKIHTLRDVVDILSTVESIAQIFHTISSEDRQDGVTDAKETKADQPMVLLQALYAEEKTAFTNRYEEEIVNAIKEQRSRVSILKNKLDKVFEGLENNYDRLLFLDLCRLSVDHQKMSPQLLQLIGHHKIDNYRRAVHAKVAIEETVEEMARQLFHELTFFPWKEKEGKTFIQHKRIEEKKQKTYARPYIDYFDKEEKRMFRLFWEEHKSLFLSTFMTGQLPKASRQVIDPYIDHFLSWHRELSLGAHRAIEWRKAYDTLQKSLHGLNADDALSYLATMRSYHDLSRPLWGKYRNIRNKDGVTLEKHLAAAFYPVYGFGFCRSYAFRQAVPQGSIFKLVTGYTALMQRYHQLNNPYASHKELNPFTMIDRVFRKGDTLYVGETVDGKAIPRMYHSGRLPKSLSSNNGMIDLIKAIETSSNPYFSLLAGEFLDSPWDLATSAELFSYGAKTGIELPGEIKGSIPNDLDENKTGLYSFAIGHHSFAVTPLQAAVMLSAIANGGKVIKPKIVAMKAGRERDPDLLPTVPYDHFPCEESLALVGIDFPLFTATIDPHSVDSISPIPTEVQRTVPMPAKVREMLLKGMERVMAKISHDLLWSLAVKYQDYPEAILSIKNTSHLLVGKSSSAEFMEAIGLDQEHGVEKSTHIWFGGISFEDENPKREKAELVIVIYLRFGGLGKDAAPLAAQIVEKWHEIKQKRKI